MGKIRWLSEQGIPDSIESVVEYDNNGYKRVKKVSWVENKYSCFVTQPEVDRLCDEIVQWARKTDAMRASSFMIDFEIMPTTWGRWVDKFPELGTAYEHVKLIFAEKREKGASKGEYNQAIVMATLPVYCREYREYRQELAATKAKENGSGTVVNVSMEKMPSTDDVPPKRYEGND